MDGWMEFIDIHSNNLYQNNDRSLDGLHLPAFPRRRVVEVTRLSTWAFFSCVLHRSSGWRGFYRNNVFSASDPFIHVTKVSLCLSWQIACLVERSHLCERVEMAKDFAAASRGCDAISSESSAVIKEHKSRGLPFMQMYEKHFIYYGCRFDKITIVSYISLLYNQSFVL